MMNIPSVVEAFYKGMQTLFGYFIRNSNSVVSTIAIGTFLFLAAQVWYARSERNLVLFVGAPGSSTSEIGPKIADGIRATASPGGATYNITVETTPDNMSIRERMAAEKNRYALGIIEDGNGFDSDEKNTTLHALLPLEWDYLYVLCGKKLYEKAYKKHKQVLTLADVIDELEPGTLYIGPEKSSTNRIATLAIEKYSAVAIDKISKNIADWTEMRSALKRGELQLVFAKGPIGSTLLEDVAGDESAILLSLGTITDAIQWEGGFQVYSAELPQDLCTAKKIKMIGVGNHFESFCRPKLTTLASRRVLACSQTMSTSDAYLLAQVASKVCEDEQYHVNLAADDRPHGGDPTLTKTILRMPVHHGLQLLRDRETPMVLRDWRTWPAWLVSVACIFVGFIALDGLNWLTKNLSVTQANEAVASESITGEVQYASEPSARMSYNELFTLVEEYIAAIELQTYTQTIEQLDVWDKKIRKLRIAIINSKNISSTEREILFAGIRELRLLLSQSAIRNQIASTNVSKPSAIVTPEPSTRAPDESV